MCGDGGWGEVADVVARVEGGADGAADGEGVGEVEGGGGGGGQEGAEGVGYRGEGAVGADLVLAGEEEGEGEEVFAWVVLVGGVVGRGWRAHLCRGWWCRGGISKL